MPILEASGHRAVAIDLPGHGEDRTPSYRVTLGRYADTVCRAARAQGGRVIALGHSMGGLAISRAAAASPDMFSGLVYLSAFVPASGESLFQLARQDPESLVLPSARIRLTRVKLRPGCTREAFYTTCSDADVAWATSRLRPDPLLPLLQRYPAHPELGIPRAYIECSLDRAISLPRQRAMYQRFAFDRVVTMDADHSPFLSVPGALAEHLDSLAEPATWS